MIESTPFIVFADCMLVEGNSRSSICDIRRNKIHLIPNSLYHILIKYNGQTLKDIKAFYSVEETKIIDEYFNFLIREEIILFTNQIDNFPKLNNQWHSPFLISNCIVDYSSSFHSSYETVIKSLNNLLCQAIEVRFYDKIDNEHLNGFLDFFDKTTIHSINLVLKYSENLNYSNIEKIYNQHKRISSIVIFDSGKEYILNENIKYVQLESINAKSCGKIESNFFQSNILLYTESLAHNTCLNRKIAIDTEGNIKNCPSMNESFGNISNTILEEAISKSGFKKYWDITKDQIAKCKDCEFRHVCTDCRAYLENPDDIYSAPLKCGYDPYSCEWQEWSANPLKQKAIDYYEMREILNNR